MACRIWMVLLPGIFFFLFTGVEAGVMGDVREGGDAYRQALREKVGEVAEIRYKKALEAKKGGPDGDKVLMRLGLYRFFKGDYAGSEYYLRRLIERFEGSDLVGEAELWLGRTFLSRGDTRSALVEFRKGLQGLERSGSEDSELLGKYYFWLGETYSRDGNLAEARRCLETVQGMSIVHLRPSLVRDRLRSVYGALGVKGAGGETANEDKAGADRDIKGGERYYVQAGSFSSQRNASRVVENLEAVGLKASIRVVGIGDVSYYRVVLGDYGTRKEAETVAERVKKEGYERAILKKEK